MFVLIYNIMRNCTLMYLISAFNEKIEKDARIKIKKKKLSYNTDTVYIIPVLKC